MADRAAREQAIREAAAALAREQFRQFVEARKLTITRPGPSGDWDESIEVVPVETLRAYLLGESR